MSDQDTQTIERNADAVRRFLQETHSGNPGVVDELVDPEIRTHGFPGCIKPASREEYKQFFEVMARLWADMEFEVPAIVADEDQVAARFIVRATHASDALGVPPTGKRVTFSGMALYRMRDGRIAETWLYPDNVSVLEQVGVLPTAA